MKTKPLPDRETLTRLLDYDPETGALTWRERVGGDPRVTKGFNTRSAGTEAFTATFGPRGYRVGMVERQVFLAHRIIWKMIHNRDPVEIDHINGDGSDNRLENLREVDRSANNGNQRLRRDSKSGHPGVYWCSKRGIWYAQITKNGKTTSSPTFIDKDQAVAWRKDREREMHFHPNHGRA